MTRPSFKQRALPLSLAAMAAGGLVSSEQALAASSSKAITYSGSTVSEQWGTVQVSIVVKNKKITNVVPTVTDHTGRSQMITAQALPALKQEVLQAQSANIQLVSGATDLSQGYVQSLQSAVNKARKAKTL